MADFINNINNKAGITGTTIPAASTYLPQNNPVVVKTEPTKPDTVEISDKEKKKKLITYSAITAGVVLAIAAFVKRKAIGEFFSRLFKKEVSGEPPKAPKSATDVSAAGEIKPILPAKTHIEEYQELLDAEQTAWKAAKDAASQNGGGGVKELEDAKHAASRALHAYEEKARTENFSLVVKKVFRADAAQEERLEYFTRHAFGKMKCSEASAFDGLDMFEKYGMRMKYDKNGIHNPNGLYETLDQLLSTIPDNPSDKLIDRYIDVYSKYLQESAEDSKDADSLMYFLTKQKGVYENISEATLIKGIKTLGRITHDDHDTFVLRLTYTDTEFQRRFKNNEAVKKSLEDFERVSLQNATGVKQRQMESFQQTFDALKGKAELTEQEKIDLKFAEYQIKRLKSELNNEPQ